MTTSELLSLIETFILFFGLMFTGLTIYSNSKSRKTSILHDMIKEERDISLKYFDFITKQTNGKISGVTVDYLISNHLNFYEHLAMLIKEKKMDDNVAKRYFKDLLKETYNTYQEAKPNLVKKYTEASYLYNKWYNTPAVTSEKPKFISNSIIWLLFTIVCIFIYWIIFNIGIIFNLINNEFNQIFYALGVVIIALIINYSPVFDRLKTVLFNISWKKILLFLAILVIIFSLTLLYIYQIWMPSFLE